MSLNCLSEVNFTNSTYLDPFPEMGSPKSSALVGLSVIDHPLGGIPMYVNPHMFVLWLIEYSTCALNVDLMSQLQTVQVFQHPNQLSGAVRADAVPHLVPPAASLVDDELVISRKEKAYMEVS